MFSCVVLSVGLENNSLKIGQSKVNIHERVYGCTFMCVGTGSKLSSTFSGFYKNTYKCVDWFLPASDCFKRVPPITETNNGLLERFLRFIQKHLFSE